jgi:hypothetical protein
MEGAMGMMLAIAAVAAAAVATPGPVNQIGIDAGASASPPTRADAIGDPKQVICKLIEKTGSHLRRSYCLSRADWNELTASSKQAAHDMVANQGGLDERSAMSPSNGK